MSLFYYLDSEMNYDVLESKSPYVLVNKKKKINKSEMKSKMKNHTNTPLGMQTLFFTSSKNCEFKVKFWWVEAWERKKEWIFSKLYFAVWKFL